MENKYDVRHTTFGKYTAIVTNLRGTEKWYANIYYEDGVVVGTVQRLVSQIKDGKGEKQLHETLKEFGAGDRLKWSEGYPQ